MRNLNDFKDRLVKEHKYTEDFAISLATSAESIIDYIGEEYETLVKDAIASCKYEISKKPKRSVLGYASTESGYSANPKIVFENGTFSIAGVEKKITLPNTFNTDNPAYIGDMINKTISLVRAEASGFTINGSTLSERRGFENTEYKLKLESGEVKREMTRKTGTSLENGMTSYSELSIMRTDYDSTYELANGNDYARNLAGVLSDGIGLKNLMIEAAMSGNTEKLASLIESATGLEWKEFISLTDGIAKREQAKRDASLDSEKLKSALKNLDDYYAEKIAPMTRMIINNLDLNLEEEQTYQKVA